MVVMFWGHMCKGEWGSDKGLCPLYFGGGGSFATVKLDPPPFLGRVPLYTGPPIASKLTFACKTETLGSLYSHALLFLTKSSKSKYQLVHEQKYY